MAFVQANRRIAITTPLGQDALLLRGFNGREALSELFSFDLDLVSENDSLKRTWWARMSHSVFMETMGRSVPGTDSSLVSRKALKTGASLRTARKWFPGYGSSREPPIARSFRIKKFLTLSNRFSKR